MRQFFKKRVYLIVLAIFLFVILLHYQNQRVRLSGPTLWVDRAIVFVYGPLHNGLNMGVGFFGEIWHHYMALVGIGSENDRLRDELRLKNLQLVALQEKLRSQTLEAEVDEKMNFLGFDGVSARVQFFDPLAQSQTVWIDAGTAAGIRVDHPVMSPDGLVGRVIRVFADTAQVLLLVDPHCAVDVVNQETRARAIMVGSGGRLEAKTYPLMSHLEFLQNEREMQPGSLLLTSGVGAIYPPGIPVGKILQENTSRRFFNTENNVLPAVDFGKLEGVVVITGKL